MATCYINGKRYVVSGSNITICDGQVYCNGKRVVDCRELAEKNITITIEGNVETLKASDCSVNINGVVGGVETGSGDVVVHGDVVGSVQTGSGDVTCGDISGNVKTGSGDVKCTATNTGAKPKVSPFDKVKKTFKNIIDL